MKCTWIRGGDRTLELRDRVLCSLPSPGDKKYTKGGKFTPRFDSTCAAPSHFFLSQEGCGRNQRYTANKQISLNPRKPISILESVNRSSVRNAVNGEF